MLLSRAITSTSRHGESANESMSFANAGRDLFLMLNYDELYLQENSLRARERWRQITDVCVDSICKQYPAGSEKVGITIQGP